MRVRGLVVLTVALFLVTLAVHGYSTVTNAGGDSYWSTFTAHSLLTDHNLELSEYRDIINDQSPNLYRRTVDGRQQLYNYFPYGTSVMAMPLLVVADAWFHLHGTNISRYLHTHPIPKGLEHFLASVFTALTAAALFWLGLLRLGRDRWVPSLIAAGIYSFATSAWSVASRALWMHGPSMLVLTVALILVLLAERDQRWVAALGAVVAWSYVVRPTNSVSVVVLTVLVAVRWRRYLPLYFAGAAVVGLPFVALNLHVFGRLLPPYNQASRLFTGAHFFTAIAGDMVSPARGLAVYMPVVLGLAIAGFVVRARARSVDGLEVAAVAVVLVHWAVIASFYHWWGGWSYGPRFFSDVTPYLLLLGLPALDRLVAARRPWTNPRLAVAVAVTLVALSWSVFVNWRGATRQSTTAWNFTPENVDLHPSRLWDWRDPQFLR
jgi:hypothetical protein